MSAPGFWREIAIAAALSIGAAVAAVVLAPIVPAPSLARAIVCAAGAAYLAALLAGVRARVGRVVTMGAWAATTFALVLFDPSLAAWAIAQTGLIWLARSLYRYESLFAAFADLALGATALACALGAGARTHSVMLAFWCFFLVQALHVFVPRRWAVRETTVTADPFAAAHRSADAALRRMSSGRV